MKMMMKMLLFLMVLMQEEDPAEPEEDPEFQEDGEDGDDGDDSRDGMEMKKKMMKCLYLVSGNGRSAVSLAGKEFKRVTSYGRVMTTQIVILRNLESAT